MAYIVNLICGFCGQEYQLQLEDLPLTMESLTTLGAPCCCSDVQLEALDKDSEVFFPLFILNEGVWYLGQPQTIHRSN